MAKLKAADMTAEQLEARHAKAKERRENRKSNDMEAIIEIVSLLPANAKLSENAQRLVSRLKQEYTARNVYTPKAGDTLAQIFSEHPNISAKKLQKKCAEAGLSVDWATGTLVVAE